MKIRIIAAVFAVIIIAIIIWIFLSKNEVSKYNQPYSDEKTQMVSREFDDEWSLNHIMWYDCEALSQEDSQEYCKDKQQKLYDFYAPLSWDIIEPQLTEKQLEGFYCDLLSSPEDKKCKDTIFLHMGQK